MATIYTCDRCGSFNTQRNDVKAIDVPRSWQEDYDTYKVELCKSCLKGLEEYVKSKPQVKT